MKVGDRDSDHQPLEVEIKRRNNRITEQKKGEKKKMIAKWDKDSVEKYKRRVANVQIERKSVEECGRRKR